LKISGRYQDVPKAVQLDYQDDEYVWLGTPDETGRASKRAKVNRVLPAEEPGLTVEEVALSAGLKPKAARTALEESHSLGLSDRSGLGRKGSPYRYWRIGEVDEPQEQGDPLSQLREMEVTEV
jgi:hypothetical protein